MRAIKNTIRRDIGIAILIGFGAAIVVTSLMVVVVSNIYAAILAR